MTTVSQRVSRWLLKRMGAPYDSDSLRRSAVVFAPHFDDETLGCGGTILKKVQAHARVSLVFMTDGSRSHPGVISPAELRAVRSEEARNAARLLGIDSWDVFFLDYEETKLSDHLVPCSERVRQILQQVRPEEIFIPYCKDSHSYHVAANRIILRAVQSLGRGATIYEYPIWFWCYWPWVSSGAVNNRNLLHTVWCGLVSQMNLLRDFRCFVPIKDVLDLKRQVLDQYKSQMTRLRPAKTWRTLHDVSGGAFLECFFQQHEIFCSYQSSPSEEMRAS